MKTGDTIRDTQGTAWQLGQALGRGLWGKSFLVRREFDDALFVLKAPLTPDDFRGEFQFSDVVISASRAAILEQARLYGDGGHNFLPRLEARASLSAENTGYILPHFPQTLQARIAAGLPLAELVEILIQVAKLARQLPNGYHGNLRANNVLLSDDNGVFFTDVVTNAGPRAITRMIAACPSHAPAFPPEISEATGEVALNAGCDSWAIAMMLWEGVLSGEPLPNHPRQGLDKSAIQAVRDRVMDKMKAEDSNPRFHARLAERVAILMSRALSREQSPSPPFRFPKSEDLHGRLEEITQLIRPHVQSVGKIMLDRPASKPWFTTDEVVAFNCLAAASAGVEGNEEIGVGIAVFDTQTNERLKDLPLSYTSDRHPTGRYRFAFRIEGLYPGNFKARLAFAIRDSGHPPTTAEVDFLIRPAPGWVPPEQPAPPPAPLPFEREQPSVTMTRRPPSPTMVPDEPSPEPARAEPSRVEPPRVELPRAEAPRVDLRPAPAPEPRPSVVMPPPGPTPIAPRPATLPPPRAQAATMPTIATATAPPPTPGPVVHFPRPLAPEPLRDLDEELDAPVPKPQPTVRLAAARTMVPEPPPEEEYVPIRPRAGWNQDPVGVTVRDLDDEDDGGDDLPPAPTEPSALERLWEQAKGDPYVLVVGGLSLVAVVLIAAVFFFR